MLAALPPADQAEYARDFRNADETIGTGRVAATTEDRLRFWQRWIQYVRPLPINPYLISTPFQPKIRAITGFAERVRSGYYGHGDRVSCGRVQTAIRAVSQTCELDNGESPIRKGPKEYLKPLELLFAGYRKQDPDSVPELAVPVTLVNQIVTQYTAPGTTAKDHAIADLSLIAFYFLLRVGEYTHPRKKGTTRTQQFRFQDIAFKHENTFVQRDAPNSTILQATGGTLRLSNQKNGIRGSLIHRCKLATEDTTFCPIKALGRRYLHLRDNNASKDDLISLYWDHNGQHHIQPDDILKAVRIACVQLKLESQGITPDRIGSHSLRAGGAMALKFAGADRDDIKKLGRWSSDTFLIYIHDQIAAYQEGWTTKMAEHRDFFNLEGAFSTLHIDPPPLA